MYTESVIKKLFGIKSVNLSTDKRIIVCQPTLNREEKVNQA